MRVPLIVAASVLASFVVTADALAADVEVALVGDASEVQGCQRLAEVEANSLLTGVMASKGRKRTIVTLKSRAAALGATHVQVLSSNFTYASNNMLGVAYRCQSEAQPLPTIDGPVAAHGRN